MSALNGTMREKTGKSEARAVRAQDQLPACLYGLDDNINLQVDPKELVKILHDNGRNALIELSIKGDSKPVRKVLLKDLQTHPLEEAWVHVDFLELDLAKKIKVRVPLVLKGHSPGEKLGGIVNHATRILDIECLPDDIPTAVDVDLEKVELGQAIHVSDLDVPENVTVLNRPEDTVVTVQLEKVVQEETEEEEEGEAVEAAEESSESGEDDSK